MGGVADSGGAELGWCLVPFGATFGISLFIERVIRSYNIMAHSTARARTATLDPPVSWVRAELHLPHANITVHRTDQPQGSLGSPSVLTTPVHGEVLWGILRC